MLFRSKIDLWLAIALIGTVIITLAAAVATLQRASGVALLLAISIAISTVLPIWTLAFTIYMVEGKTLLIRSGPFRWRIPVSSIRRIEPSNSVLSGPALSLVRLRIEYGTGQSILVSPADQQGFLRAIESAKNASTAQSLAQADARQPSTPSAASK